MFYINEFFFRLKFFILSVSMFFFICYIYNKNLLFIFLYPILKCILLNNFICYFIYTDPTEIFIITFFIIFILFLYLYIPYFLWQLLDFFKSSFYCFEYNKINKIYIYFIFFILLINYFLVFFFLPKIWLFFDTYNNFIILNQILEIYTELKIKEYYYFIFNILYSINFSLFFIYFFLFFLTNIKVIYLLSKRKLFFFLNLVFATLLSPPEVSGQIIILIFLTFICELLLFFNILDIKKYLMFNKAIN